MKRINTVAPLLLLLFVIMAVPRVYTIRQPVNKEEFMDKMEKSLGSLSVPSPETIDELMTQVEGTCQANLTNPIAGTMENMTTCLRNLFNSTNLMDEVRDAVPKGNLDVVFRNICVKWPQMKGCMKDGLESVGHCWGHTTREKLIRGMDTVVNFFCGSDNDGARVALFIAEEGLPCIENFGEEIGTCFSDQISELEEHELPADICKILGFFHNCLRIMKKCSNLTPENLVNAVVVEVGRVMECKTFKKTNFKVELVKEKELDYPVGDDDIVNWGISDFMVNFMRDEQNSLKKVLEEILDHCKDSLLPEPEMAKFMKAVKPCQAIFPSPASIIGSQENEEMVKQFCANVSIGLDCLRPEFQLLKLCSRNGFVVALIAANVQKKCAKSKESF